MMKQLPNKKFLFSKLASRLSLTFLQCYIFCQKNVLKRLSPKWHWRVFHRLTKRPFIRCLAAVSSINSLVFQLSWESCVWTLLNSPAWMRVKLLHTFHICCLDTHLVLHCLTCQICANICKYMLIGHWLSLGLMVFPLYFQKSYPHSGSEPLWDS